MKRKTPALVVALCLMVPAAIARAQGGDAFGAFVPAASASASGSSSAQAAPSGATSAPAAASASTSALPPEAPAATEEDPVVLGKVSLTYLLERVEVRGNLRTLSSLVKRYVPFREGQVFDVDDPELELSRYRLLGTGFFQKVSYSLRRGAKRGAVVLVVEVTERNTIVVNDVWLGLSATADRNGEPRPLSAYTGLDAAETNLAGTGVTLGGAFAVAEDQLALRLRYFDPSFRGSPWMTHGTLLYNLAREFYGTRDVRYDDPVGGASRVEDFAVVRYRRVGGSVGVGRDLSVSTQLFVDYRLEGVDAELPRAASHRRGARVEPLEYHLLPGKSLLSALHVDLAHDTRVAPVLPTRGYLVQAALDVAMTPLGSSYAFQKVQLRTSRWWQLKNGHVLRLEAFGGALSGDAPVFERFYVADLSDLLPDRVLELNTDRRPAPNFFGTDVAEVRFGEYAAKVQLEHRVPVYRGVRSVYGVDAFTAAGVYGIAARRDIDEPPVGYSGFARVPIDFTFNLGLRIDTKAGGFVFALANPLGFVPVLRGRR